MKKSTKNILAVLSAAFMSFVGILTETSLNVTFPTMMKEFKVSLDTIQWTTTGYLLMIAIIMICSSYLNDRFTARQLFIIACVGFMVGSVISAIAPNFPILLLGRLISALGAGLSTPLMFNLITEIMPRSKWGRLYGNRWFSCRNGTNLRACLWWYYYLLFKMALDLCFRYYFCSDCICCWNTSNREIS